MRKNSATGMILVCILTACGSATPDAQPERDDEHSGPVAGRDIADDANGATLWHEYGAARKAASEAERAESLTELTGMADRVVVGSIADVRPGRMVDMVPEAPSARVQFANFHIEVSRDSASGGESEVVIELPIRVSSDALYERVQAAVSASDVNGDGAIDEDEVAAGYDGEAVQRAYADHWDAAVEETLADLRRQAPASQTIFLLRYEAEVNTYRPINGDAVIVDDDGRATSPMRGPDERSVYPVAAEVSRMTFAEAVARVFER